MTLNYLFIIPTCLLLAVSDWAEAQPAHPIPIDSSYNLPAVYKLISRDFPQAVPADDSLPTGVLAFRDLIYASLEETPYGKRLLHADLFRPAATGQYPLLVMIHGGGWRSGNKRMQVPMAQLLAAKGFVTMAVEYQLAPEAQYPAAIHNIKSAIRWARLHASGFGIDTSRVAISGCSAGGHLAALTGLTNNISSFEGSMGNTGAGSQVQAIVDIDGVLDFMAPASLNLVRKPDSPDITWLGGSFANKPLTWKEASPIFWAEKDRAVPMLFLNSGYSKYHAGQDELLGMLGEWDIYTEVHKFDVKLHPFWLFHPWVDETVDRVAAFLKKVL